MIKIDNINVIVDGSEYSAKVEIPSQVTTSTPQEETVDLANTPNLFIKVVDPDNTLKIGVNVEAQLTTEEGTYTMICDVVSKNQMYTTLQYAYGMTFEEDDSSDDPETETYNINEAMIDGCTVAINPNPAAEGETVTVTVTPNQGQVFNSIEARGSDTMTNITITDLGNNQYSFTMPAENVDLNVYCLDSPDPDPEEPTVDPVLSQSINNILGSNYDVVNDMSEEDALAAANNILYGDEEQPR